MQLLKLLVVDGESLPGLALSQWFRGCFHTCDAFVSLLGLDRIRVPWCQSRFVAAQFLLAAAFSHRRNPRKNQHVAFDRTHTADNAIGPDANLIRHFSV